MSRKILLISLLFIGQLSFSSDRGEITRFSCRTDEIIEGSRPTKFFFQVQDLERNSITYYSESESDEPVKMIPESSILDLNDNWGIRREEDRIALNSDGDGCQWTDVVLYKSHHYRKGYARVKDTGCGRNAYSKVTCFVK